MGVSERVHACGRVVVGHTFVDPLRGARPCLWIRSMSIVLAA